MNKQVNIIIPVYNAYEDLTKCIASVWRHTDLSNHKVIIVNDCSPDIRISPYIHSIEGDGIFVIENEENIGFSGSVNKGIQFSADKDVVLLNSDTIVTVGWIDKLLQCAYSEHTIGTVTPLSNSATLASLPVAFQDNEIPANVTIKGFADLVERSSFRDYPQIPVAVGFCMFIKREVIKQVGLFDVKTFQRGYGEENDFCNRMELYGYKNVLCDDTFVFHKGTGSFQTKEKQKLIQQHEKILYERYPAQMRNNAVFCSQNPQQYIRDNINIYLKFKNRKKNILLVSHFDFRENSENNVGGVQYHVMDITNILRKEYNVFVMARDRSKMVLTAYYGSESMTFCFEIGLMPPCTLFSDKKFRELYFCILCAFQINLIHIHHVQGMTLDIFNVAKELNIPIFLSLHDYYYICPNVKMVNQEKKSCTVDNEEEDNCKKCLHIRCGISYTVDYMQCWRKKHSEVIEMCDCIIAPTQSAKEVYCKSYPDLENKIVVIEHGRDKVEYKRDCIYVEPVYTKYAKIQIENVFQKNSDKDAINGWAFLEGVDCRSIQVFVDVMSEDGNIRRYPTNKLLRKDVDDVFNGGKKYEMAGFYATIHVYEIPDEKATGRIVIKYQDKYYTDNHRFSLVKNIIPAKRKLNIAFFGGISYEKGAEKVNEVIKADTEKKFNWFLFGGTEEEQAIQLLNQDNVYAAGKYERDEIFQLIEQYHIDLVCMLPIWKETFCYTLSEAYLCNIPVIATNIGAVGERVGKIQKELVVDVNISGKDLLQKICNIANDSTLLQKYKQQLQMIPHKSVKKMSEEYNKLYTPFLNRDIAWMPFSAKTIYNGYLADQETVSQSKEQTVSGIEMLIQEEKTYREISHSLEQKELEIAQLQQSVWYKVSQKMQKMKIPFRSIIRKAIIWLLPDSNSVNARTSFRK